MANMLISQHFVNLVYIRYQKLMFAMKLVTLSELFVFCINDNQVIITLTRQAFALTWH